LEVPDHDDAGPAGATARRRQAQRAPAARLGAPQAHAATADPVDRAVGRPGEADEPARRKPRTALADVGHAPTSSCQRVPAPRRGPWAVGVPPLARAFVPGSPPRTSAGSLPATIPISTRYPGWRWPGACPSLATSTAPCGGVGEPGAASRPGRAVLDRPGRVHPRLPGDGRRPLRRRHRPPDRGPRPGGAARQRLARRGRPGAAGHRGRRAGPAAGGTGAAGGGAELLRKAPPLRPAESWPRPATARPWCRRMTPMAYDKILADRIRELVGGEPDLT